jgi:hypothetical protein
MRAAVSKKVVVRERRLGAVPTTMYLFVWLFAASAGIV